ncbi:hypothetical protein P167DRAFT_537579 [Morchella conica CCBAS932]|uniref:Uncharacterized protein n=1 Tax=Morchella conica CCBAS932 TaxID=1392247 RepID=A0A3N4KIP6_9PEZI|nr:hypothetical protein P167DRAFT_537579 [Morchella conica CCBAS932]
MNLGEQCERTPTAGPWGLFFIILILYHNSHASRLSGRQVNRGSRLYSGDRMSFVLR